MMLSDMGDSDWKSLQVYLRICLIKRGALVVDADEVVSDVLGEVSEGEEGLLKKFSGKRKELKYWLARISINRWLDRMRRSRFEVSTEEEGGVSNAEATADDAIYELDDEIAVMFAQVFQVAMAGISPYKMLLVRLHFIYEIPQNVLSLGFQIHTSKVCRLLRGALEELKSGILLALKERDPKLEITWEDIQRLVVSGQLELNF